MAIIKQHPSCSCDFISTNMRLLDVKDPDHSSSVVLPRTASLFEIGIFHCYSLWLFTSSDLKTIVGPSLVFGITNALGVANYGLRDPRQPMGNEIVRRLPVVLLWIWMNLLPSKKTR